MLFSQALLYLAGAVSLSCAKPPTSQTYPLVPGLGSSQGIFAVSKSTPFDGPKLNHVNATTFDWWYFDAVSNDATMQLSIVFFSTESTTLGFPFSTGTTNFIVFTALFNNGTVYQNIIPGGDAVITTVGDGSSGTFDLTGGSWVGSPDLSHYEVNVENLLVGISGSMKLQSTVPAHVPCDINRPDASEHLTDTVGWANAVPDANAIVDFSILGYDFSFTGYGYHDKNWGLQPLPDAVGSWYWGHARLGPYSLVYFDTLQPDGTEVVSGYLTKNGEIISLGCSGLRVRPIGTEYPPTATTPVPVGYTLKYQTKKGTFAATLTGATAWVAPLLHPGWGYNRFSGVVKGGFVGQQQYTGAGVYEWIRFLP